MTYLTKKINLIFVIFFFINFQFNSYSFENKIVYKINNEIITSYDIKREFKYLALINPKVIDLEKKRNI